MEYRTQDHRENGDDKDRYRPPPGPFQKTLRAVPGSAGIDCPGKIEKRKTDTNTDNGTHQRCEGIAAQIPEGKHKAAR